MHRTAISVWKAAVKTTFSLEFMGMQYLFAVHKSVLIPSISEICIKFHSFIETSKRAGPSLLFVKEHRSNGF